MDFNFNRPFKNYMFKRIEIDLHVDDVIYYVSISFIIKLELDVGRYVYSRRSFARSARILTLSPYRILPVGPAHMAPGGTAPQRFRKVQKENKRNKIN